MAAIVSLSGLLCKMAPRYLSSVASNISKSIHSEYNRRPSSLLFQLPIFNCSTFFLICRDQNCMQYHRGMFPVLFYQGRRGFSVLFSSSFLKMPATVRHFRQSHIWKEFREFPNNLFWYHLQFQFFLLSLKLCSHTPILLYFTLIEVYLPFSTCLHKMC